MPTTLSALRFVAIREFADELVCIGICSRSDNGSLVARLVHGVGDVLLDRSIEQDRLLSNHGHFSMQILMIVLVNFSAVDENPSIRRIVETFE